MLYIILLLNINIIYILYNNITYIISGITYITILYIIHNNM